MSKWPEVGDGFSTIGGRSYLNSGKTTKYLIVCVCIGSSIGIGKIEESLNKILI